ncbi:phosphoribosylanthranilate isomerase [Streptomyces sp. NPDC059063]|uniref:phosphoribosylanthranilate isomerase n=1 Tax=unclassified Streptomyces TaxID=2593676 RepID=UPI003693E3F7
MFVKICGLREPAHVAAAVDAGADAIGFVLTPSPRRITPDRMRTLVADVPPHVLTVAVLAGASPAQVAEAVDGTGVAAVQLHGDAYTTRDYAAVRDLPLRLVRAVSGTGGADLVSGSHGEELLIVDAPRPGSGEPWDWAALAGRAEGRWLLAGGLGPGNVRAAVTDTRAWGVDVSSGVESRRGVKDTGLIREFVAAARGD